MKNSSFRYLTGSFLFIALVHGAYAQTSKLHNELTNPSSKEVAYANDAKELESLSGAGDAMTSINTKAVKSFSKSYKKSHATWFAIPDGFVAIFSENGIKTKVYYDNKGRLIGDIQTYQEDKLPKEIRHQVKSTYYDFNIMVVNELTVGSEKVYLVKIEDKTSFMTLRLQNGEMTETEVYQKSK